MAGEAEDNSDQSMEEILQSIKRIIAEDDEPESHQQAAAADSTESVLELTEMVQDDGTVSHVDDLSKDAALQRADSAALPSSDESLVSTSVAQASAAALKSLAHKEASSSAAAPKLESPAFRSGATVEDLVLEALRPMLKQWLDANLPGMVENLVQKEIRRISGN